LMNLNSEVPLFGAMRGGVVAVGYPSRPIAAQKLIYRPILVQCIPLTRTSCCTMA
jgi:hypothetical protein